MEKKTFDYFDIADEIKDAVYDMGFKHPSPIQELAIPKALELKDIIGQAQTGSGKTLAFAIPILEKIFIKDKSPQAIVLCPTRELCIQVAGEIEKLTKYLDKITVLAVYGGQPIGKQIRVLNKGAHIIVGTPGRVLDHINRGTLDLIGIETVVLDEADEMLDMGFREDIETILRYTPKQRQTMLFSATMPPAIRKITKFYQENPEFIKIANDKKHTPEIEQYYFETSDKNKPEALSRLLDLYNCSLALVFCNTKKRVDYLVNNLRHRGYKVDGIHGDMKQKVRDKVMNKFRNRNINILVATDVAARGIDVANVEIVFNYDVPQNNEYYIHRIGRTARAGSSGLALTLVSPREIHSLQNIRKTTKVSIKQRDIPSIKQLESLKNDLVMDDIKKSIKNDDLSNYIKVIEKSVKNNYNPVLLAAALLKRNRENS